MPDPNAIIKLQLEYSGPNASETLNVFHWRVDNSFISNTLLLSTLTDWVNNDWGPVWAQLAPGVSSIIGGDVTEVNGDGTLAEVIGTITTPVTGGVAAEQSPAAVSAFIQAPTTRPGSFGRKYVPFVSNGVMDDGALDAVGDAALQLLLLVLLTEIDPTGAALLIPGVRSTVLNAFLSFLTSGMTEDIPGYQRRRKPQVGS